jgi:hypothetical protein
MARRRPTEQTANPARGAALVVVAVLIGLVLLRHGLDTSETVVPTTPSGTTDGATTGGATAGAGSTTSTVAGAVRPPAQVPTIVLNGSGVKGAAKKYSDALAANGYDLTSPTGGNSTSNVTATQVLYSPGFAKEAAAVATAIGAPQTAVAALGTTLPGTTNSANVVVVLGPDLGNKTPTATPTTAA